LQTLQDRLPKVKIGRNSNNSSVIAYADDVIIFVTCSDNLKVIKSAITSYERASVASINPTNPRALPIGHWVTTPTKLGIALTDQIRILGVAFSSNMERSAKLCWERVINAVRAEVCTTYGRQVDLAQRMQFIMRFHLAKLWYVAQVFPASRSHAQR
jgi:hypothetical protein